MEDADKRALLAHTVPYGAWWLCKFMLDVPQISPAWQYVIRSIVCLVLFLAFRPWQWYGPLRAKNALLALGIGIFIFFVWVGPESKTLGAWSPALQGIYNKLFVGLLWMKREVPAIPPYAPDICGWPLSLARLAGSAFVIAIIEEFAFRGFLYRAAIGGLRFTRVDPGTVDGVMFMLVATTFALEHNEWLAGLICGIAYGWLFVQTRDIWATSIAHITTNFLLGVYVLWAGAHQFW